VPELPETETIARDLAAAITGRLIHRVEVHRADVLRGTDAPALAQTLGGAGITDVRRRAKSIVLGLGDCGRVVVTPRFTGALLLDGTPDHYDALHLHLDDGTLLRYRDVRRLGTVAWHDATSYRAWDAALGPEPLDPELTAATFTGIVRASTRAVKTILMDQRRLAGIGNIYATEALWHAGVRPSRPGAQVSRAACTALLGALRRILTNAIAARGTTFRDYQDARGGRGGYATQLQAYGRAAEPCLRCGTPLASDHALEGRRTVHCPRCQR
jgi:formamidopyrimidine-DNA glycosylase